METPKSTQDRIREYQAGIDREGNFQALYEEYGKAVFRYFAHKGFPAAACPDLTQETFLGVYRGLDKFKLESSFKTWLYMIARNVRHNAHRDASTKKRAGTDVSLDEEVAKTITEPRPGNPPRGGWEEPEPLEDVLVGEGLRALRDAVASLSDELRRVVLLRFQDLKNGEIARLLKIPEGTVKSRLNAATKKLREMLGTLYPELEL